MVGPLVVLIDHMIFFFVCPYVDVEKMSMSTVFLPGTVRPWNSFLAEYSFDL